MTLCHADLATLQTDSPYYGATVGRVGNRIAKGRFSIGEKAYTLATNNGADALHGGVSSFSHALWAPKLWTKEGAAGVVFSLVSHDGEEGYPGTVHAEAAYSLTAANELVMEFSATTDKPTPINMCNHCYWNLSGDLVDKVHDHVLTLHTPYVLPVDATQVGGWEKVEGKDNEGHLY